MRALLFAIVLALPLAPSITLAGENDAAVAAARRQLELAQLKLRLYDRDEYPRQLGHIERAIEIAEAELESFRRRVRELEQFEDFKYSPPFFLSREEARLDVLRAEMHLRALEDERFLLIRSRSDRARVYQLEIEAAAALYNALVQQL